jgi:NET1-associated nuclear protein 1 (U3 small nucleolar RNA-associated protein 17)
VIATLLSPCIADPIGSMLSTVSIPLAVHSPSATLVLPSSHPSSLQTYSPSSSTLIAELEVSPTNRVSRQDEKPIEPLRVEMTVISSNGDWMATIDGRGGDDSFRGEIYLKMWWRDRKAGFWILKTRVDRPHGLARVTSVTFSPVESGSPLQLVTTGQDGNIKMWRIRRIKQKGGDIEGSSLIDSCAIDRPPLPTLIASEYWVARSSFKFRSEIPTHASWSSDGSLLAVSLGPFVALYDPITTALLHLWTARNFASVASAYFLARSGRYVVVVGSKEVFVWDLVTQSGL